jgi:hypothetical protein
MVHFIRGGLAWACKRYGVHGIRNNGQASNVGLFRDSWEWTSIVSRFSERQLTYKSDTLAALQGIVNRIKEVTQDVCCSSAGSPTSSSVVYSRAAYRESRERLRLTASQLILALQRVREGGTLVLLPRGMV